VPARLVDVAGIRDALEFLEPAHCLRFERRVRTIGEDDGLNLDAHHARAGVNPLGYVDASLA
jgi:hypothetical protein